MSSVELEECVIPPAMRGEPAEKVFASKCAEGEVEMTQEAFEEAMGELGCVGFAADRSGVHGVFVKHTEAITRTKFGSLRFVRTKTRKCRDVPCLVLFLLYLAAAFYIGAWAMDKGAPERLLQATDFEGNVCGRANNTGKGLIFYPELEADMVKFAIVVAQDPSKARFQNFQSAGRCVAACPSKGDTFEMGGEQYKVYFDQKIVLARCFSKYPKSPLYFAKCRDFFPNASSVAAAAAAGVPAKQAALPLLGSCARYAEEWNLPYRELCSELTGEFRAVTCLTKTKPCNSLMNTYYDSKQCCREAMTTVYPKCAQYTVGSGNYNENPLMENPVFQKMMGASAAVGRAFGDMSRTAMLILLCGGVFTMFQGILWSGLVQMLAAPVVHTTLAAAVIVPFFITVFLYAKSGLLDGSEQYIKLRNEHGLAASFGVPTEPTRPDMLALEDELKAYEYMAYGFNVVTVLILGMIISLRKFIRVAIGMIKEASRALRQMPLMIVYPIWPVSMIFLLCAGFMVVAAHLASIEKLEPVHVDSAYANSTAGGLASGLESFRQFTGGAENGTISSIVSSLSRFQGSLGRNFTITQRQQTEGALWVFGGGFVWCMNIVNGIWCCTVAGAMCRWYWKFQEDKNQKEFGKLITWHVFKKVLRYFLGSVCYGAALISAMQMTRLAFEYALHQLKNACKDPRLGKCLKFAMAIRVGLMGLQKMLEEMTMGAYVMVMMQGCSFCVGARESRQLFKVHAKLIVTTELMCSFVLALARVCCVGGSMLLLFACLETDAALPTMGLVGLQKPTISSPVAPLVVTGFFALAVVSCYIDIVHITVQALLLSYAADRELNDQTGMYAMTDFLKGFIVGPENPPFAGAAKHGFEDDDKSKPKPPARGGGKPAAGGEVTKTEKKGTRNKVVV
jgi:hypothetical protein